MFCCLYNLFYRKDLDWLMIILFYLYYFLFYRSVEVKDYKWWEDFLGIGILLVVSSDYWIFISRER